MRLSSTPFPTRLGFRPLGTIEELFAQVIRTKPWLPNRSRGWAAIVVAERETIRVFCLEKGKLDEVGSVSSRAEGGLLSLLRAVKRRSGKGPRETVLRLTAERAAIIDLHLPETDPAYMPALIRNKIERLTPWRASDVAFGYRIEKTAEPGRCRVRVGLTSLTDLNALLKSLALSKLQIDRVEVVGDGELDSPVELQNTVPSGLRRKARLVALFYALMLGAETAAACALLASGISAETTVGALRREAAAASRVGGPRDGAIRAQDLRRRRDDEPSALTVLARLSEILPDSVSLTTLSSTKGEITLRGQGEQIPTAMEALQTDGLFSSVRFGAPTVRRSDIEGDEFTISAVIRGSTAAK